MPLYFNYDVIINQAGNELNQKSALNLLWATMLEKRDLEC